MRNLASLLVPCALVVTVGCGPGPTCGADLVYNETTGLCDCLTGGTWGDDGYCRYADGAIAQPDGAVRMADASPDDDGGLPDAGPFDAGADAAPDACVTSTFYRDADGDGHGAATDPVTACVAPDGYVDSDDDCNDTCETCLPGGTELCTEPALDENCSGEANEAEVCDCTDGTSISCGTTDIGECAFGMQLCVDGGYEACEGAIDPAAEVCNGMDDDCDGTIDEGARTTFYRDADSDGFGNASMTMQACSAPAGYVTSSTDCNDACATCRPGGTEICDGLDNNCAGGIDEGVRATFYRDVDSDGYGNASMMMQACSAPAGYVTSSTDCNDACATCHPGRTEVCDGLDNNCAGGVDEGVLQRFYSDCDGDTYAPSGWTLRMACEAPARLPSCGAGDSSGWTTRVPSTGSIDCRDNNELVHPGQTTSFTIPFAGTSSYDYNCDGMTTRAVERLGTCLNHPSLGCLPSPGWTSWVDGDWPECGVTHTFVVNCTSGCAPITGSSTQACR